MTKRASILVIFILGLLLRLPLIEQPREVVFDEVHFGKFATAYCCTHIRFFDLHPPHPKLLFAGMGALAGYQGGFGFGKIGTPYPAEMPIWGLRLVPMLMGAVLPVLIYLLLLSFGAAQAVALLVAFAAVFDSAIWVHTRFILLDGVLLVAVFSALLFAKYGCEAMGVRRSWWMVGAGAGLGFAVGAKFNGLAATVPVGLVLLANPKDWRRLVFDLGLITGAFLVVYLGGWALHFALASGNPTGYDWYKPTGSFLEDVVALHRRMLKASYDLKTQHPDASPWWRWPLMGKTVYYWQGKDSVIYLVGNPVVWLSAFSGGAAGLVGLVERAWLHRRQGWTFFKEEQGALVTLAGFVGSYVPFALLKRPLFLYHYLMPLCFLMLFAGLSVSKSMSDRLSTKVMIAIVVLLVGGFVVMLPFTSGWPLVPELRARMVARLLIWR